MRKIFYFGKKAEEMAMQTDKMMERAKALFISFFDGYKKEGIWSILDDTNVVWVEPVSFEEKKHLFDEMLGLRCHAYKDEHPFDLEELSNFSKSALECLETNNYYSLAIEILGYILQNDLPELYEKVKLGQFRCEDVLSFVTYTKSPNKNPEIGNLFYQKILGTASPKDEDVDKLSSLVEKFCRFSDVIDSVSKTVMLYYLNMVNDSELGKYIESKSRVRGDKGTINTIFNLLMSATNTLGVTRNCYSPEGKIEQYLILPVDASNDTICHELTHIVTTSMNNGKVASCPKVGLRIEDRFNQLNELVTEWLAQKEVEHMKEHGFAPIVDNIKTDSTDPVQDLIDVLNSFLENNSNIIKRIMFERENDGLDNAFSSINVSKFLDYYNQALFAINTCSPAESRCAANIVIFGDLDPKTIEREVSVKNKTSLRPLDPNKVQEMAQKFKLLRDFVGKLTEYRIEHENSKIS